MKDIWYIWLWYEWFLTLLINIIIDYLLVPNLLSNKLDRAKLFKNFWLTLRIQFKILGFKVKYYKILNWKVKIVNFDEKVKNKLLISQWNKN